MCGSGVQGSSVGALDVGLETVIQGEVRSGEGEAVGGAYVRLLDGTGEFTAEVVTSSAGEFRFFAAPGDWTLRALSPHGTAETRVTAVAQTATDAPITL